MGTAKTQKDARQNPSETDFPQGRSSYTAREEAKRLLCALPLSIVHLSIWGASLLPIVLVYPLSPTRHA